MQHRAGVRRNPGACLPACWRPASWAMAYDAGNSRANTRYEQAARVPECAMWRSDSSPRAAPAAFLLILCILLLSAAMSRQGIGRGGFCHQAERQEAVHGGAVVHPAQLKRGV